MPNDFDRLMSGYPPHIGIPPYVGKPPSSFQGMTAIPPVTPSQFDRTIPGYRLINGSRLISSRSLSAIPPVAPSHIFWLPCIGIPALYRDTALLGDCYRLACGKMLRTFVLPISNTLLQLRPRFERKLLTEIHCWPHELSKQRRGKKAPGFV